MVAFIDAAYAAMRSIASLSPMYPAGLRETNRSGTQSHATQHKMSTARRMRRVSGWVG